MRCGGSSVVSLSLCPFSLVPSPRSWRSICRRAHHTQNVPRRRRCDRDRRTASGPGTELHARARRPRTHAQGSERTRRDSATSRVSRRDSRATARAASIRSTRSAASGRRISRPRIIQTIAGFSSPGTTSSSRAAPRPCEGTSGAGAGSRRSKAGRSSIAGSNWQVPTRDRARSPFRTTGRSRASR